MTTNAISRTNVEWMIWQGLLPKAALPKGRQQLLEPGDVLLSIKGGLGKVAMVQDLKHPTVPCQAFCVIRLRPNALLTPAALVQYLRSAVGQTLARQVVLSGRDMEGVDHHLGGRWALRTVIPTASAANCWLKRSARLAMYRYLIRNYRGRASRSSRPESAPCCRDLRSAYVGARSRLSNCRQTLQSPLALFIGIGLLLSCF